MISTQKIDTKLRLVSAFILTSVVWMSIVFAQCVYADSVEISSAHHDSTHCLLQDNHQVKHDKDCVDCNSIQITLPAHENTHYQNLHAEEDNQPNYAALASSDEYLNVIDSRCSTDTTLQLRTKYFLPIYLENCAFLK